MFIFQERDMIFSVSGLSDMSYCSTARHRAKFFYISQDQTPKTPLFWPIGIFQRFPEPVIKTVNVFVIEECKMLIWLPLLSYLLCLYLKMFSGACDSCHWEAQSTFL
jgi:hypothetical protein